MRLINQTKNAVLAENLIIANTPLKRLKGLLGRKKLDSGEALLLRPCNCVHTFFMRFPVDLLFLDKQQKVIKAFSCLRPFRFSPIYLRARMVIELPSGIISSTNTCSGDLLQILN